MLNSPNDRWKFPLPGTIATCTHREIFINYTVWLNSFVRDNWSCLKLEIFFKMGSQCSIVLKLSDCMLLSQAHRNGRPEIQACRARGGMTTEVVLSPCSWLFWPPVPHSWLFCSEGIPQRVPKMGPLLGGCCHEPAFAASHGASFSLVFATCSPAKWLC